MLSHFFTANCVNVKGQVLTLFDLTHIAITGSRVCLDHFLLMSSRYLFCLCSVTCFNLDKL